ncbi:DUF4912 domain-containing protein [Priestia flexa]|uniref:DUF4912 domain-containing protein n=1 Tax=Priestia flexa TaxID=86664 RepID=UPI003D2A124A
MKTKVNELDVCVVNRVNASALYVHWSFSDAIQEMVEKMYQKKWNDLSFSLCIYDVTGLSVTFDGHQSKRHTLLEVYSNQTEAFLKDMDTNCTYVVDVGVYEHHFFALIRSSRVQLGTSIEPKQLDQTKWSWSENAPQTDYVHDDCFSTYSYYTNEWNKVNQSDE